MEKVAMALKLKAKAADTKVRPQFYSRDCTLIARPLHHTRLPKDEPTHPSLATYAR